MKKLTNRTKNVLAIVAAVALLGGFTTLVSLNANASLSTGPSSVEEQVELFHTPGTIPTTPTIGSQGTRQLDNSNDVACGVFASILDKQDDLDTFSSRIVQQGRPNLYIIQEAKHTRDLLDKLAMMQGVPIKDLLKEMYPAMCSHIKA